MKAGSTACAVPQAPDNTRTAAIPRAAKSLEPFTIPPPQDHLTADGPLFEIFELLSLAAAPDHCGTRRVRRDYSALSLAYRFFLSFATIRCKPGRALI
jgi:hypothetical protein